MTDTDTLIASAREARGEARNLQNALRVKAGTLSTDEFVDFKKQVQLANQTARKLEQAAMSAVKNHD